MFPRLPHPAPARRGPTRARPPGLVPAALALALACPLLPAAGPESPPEPVEIGTGTQFLFDGHLVDNIWALKYKREAVQRVFHAPAKHPGNPVVPADGGYAFVTREGGRFRMWYQVSTRAADDDRAEYAIAYADSSDGLTWNRPLLRQFTWKGSRENNVVWTGIRGRRASSVFLLDLPPEARRGFRYVMLYRETDGMHLVGSQDGLRWDRASDLRISPIHSDTQNALVYDPARREYVLYCRAKHAYRTFRGDVIDTGESRRIARMTSRELWVPWQEEPRNVLLPDELDAAAGFDCLYGMPVTLHGGLYWGFVWPFKTNTEIHTELAWSRDGIRFERLPSRPRLVARGPEGSWDDGMVFGGCPWVEVGDEWWIYYSGWDGPHEAVQRTAGIGLARVRKEGLVSHRGPAGGGVIVTRPLKWPGGALLLNADGRRGEVRVRVSDSRRKVVPGFDFPDCSPLQGDGVRQEVRWGSRSLAELAGRPVRLEFLLRSADLFAFRAAGPGS